MQPADYARARRILARRDPVIGALIRTHGACGLARAQHTDPFHALVQAIISQQLSTAAARTIGKRLRGLYDGGMTAAAIAATPDAQLRSVGLSPQKLGYMRDLCARVQNGELALGGLDSQSDDSVIEALTRVKGIGRWTAEMFLMFRLHRPDVLPVGDLGIVKAIQKQYRLRKTPTADRLLEIGEAWRPYRSVACWYLWASLGSRPASEGAWRSVCDNLGLEQSDMAVVTPGLARTVPSIVDLIGNTPLIRLQSFEAGLRNVELWAKAEWRNPGGSVKDRGAARMVLDGEKSGVFTHDKILLDATSGNTGIAYAMLGAAKGFRVRLCVPGNVTPERKRILKAFGAEVIFTDPMDGSDGAILTAKAMYAASPDVYFYPDQYNNPGNWRAHYDTTAPELLEQTNGRITHLVSGLGTSGTFMGTGRRLREAKPNVKLISVQPDSPLHGLEGLKHMATAIVPGIYDPALADEDLAVGTEEAFSLTRELARQGLFVGISSGANLAGALNVARRTADAVVVVIFCDGGEKYLSERFWDERTEPAGGVR